MRARRQDHSYIHPRPPPGTQAGKEATPSMGPGILVTNVCLAYSSVWFPWAFLPVLTWKTGSSFTTYRKAHFALLSILSVTVHRDAHVVATPGPEDRSEVRPAPRHILGEKKRYMHISFEKAPPVLLFIGSAFVFNWKRKQLDDIIIAINTMIDSLWTLAMY